MGDNQNERENVNYIVYTGSLSLPKTEGREKNNIVGGLYHLGCVER
jgi:hypothetical protein